MNWIYFKDLVVFMDYFSIKYILRTLFEGPWFIYDVFYAPGFVEKLSFKRGGFILGPLFKDLEFLKIVLNCS